MNRRSPLLLCVLMAALATELSASQTQKLYLSGKGKDDPVQWEFFCTRGRNSGRWTSIGVPSNWELQGFGSYNYGHDNPKADEQGKYRYSFEVPADWSGRTVNIVFDGVMTDCEVKINGQSAGPVHQGGFYRFKYDITNLLEFGRRNLLEATVSKVSADKSVEAAERKADYWVFGGIYRPVYLEALPKQHIKGVSIDAKADGEITADVYLEDAGKACTLVGTVLERNGGAVSGFAAHVSSGQVKVRLSGRISPVKPWTAETPNLYSLNLSLRQDNKPVHEVNEHFGFRTFEVRAGDGLYLNGRKIRLKGVNRHSFWPDSGRCLSEKISHDDVMLIKSMNMNAVRMSHYPPDAHFLETCDELGLYVLDELAGWQKPPYDTGIGEKLVKEMVERDRNHPCILFWDNANEGGWNRELDDDFAKYDLQKRTVLHPWENFNGIDTDHYESYKSVRKKLSGSSLFMTTEFLHGLYDGGHGAGLDDYWHLIFNSPMGAAGFLWCLVDEGVVRTDRGGEIDTDGNHAPDGIVGPYREKEASYYTIKEIWSPIYVGLQKLPDDFDGDIEVENRYDFTNLNQCKFQWRLAKFPHPLTRKDNCETVAQGAITSPDVAPGEKGRLRLELPDDWREAGVLYLAASDPKGREVWTWSWAVRKDCGTCHQYVNRQTTENAEIEVTDNSEQLVFKIDGLKLAFSKTDGRLVEVVRKGGKLSFGQGPRLVTGDSKLTNFKHWRKNDDLWVQSTYEDGFDVKWKIYPSGWARLEYSYELNGKYDATGVTFGCPEDKMQKMTFVGAGPHRVWKNRTKGGRLGVWTNDYKDHTPGLTWDFPEFRGFYRDWQWSRFETAEGAITLLNGSENVYLGVYRPKDGPDPKNTRVRLPEMGISLLHGIPPIGTKFQKPQALGPQSRPNEASGRYKGVVCLYFETD